MGDAATTDYESVDWFTDQSIIDDPSPYYLSLIHISEPTRPY